MNINLAYSSNKDDAENISNDQPNLDDKKVQKDSFLVFRKNGDKLMILRQSSRLQGRYSSPSSDFSIVDCAESESSDLFDTHDAVKEENLSCEEECEEELFCDLDSPLTDSDNDFTSTITKSIEKPYSTICDICGLKFKGYNALSSHRKWKHTNVVKHECKYCGRTFRDSFCLKRHLNRVHTKDGAIRQNYRSLNCSLCSFKATEGSLICKHYAATHGYDMTEEKIRFSNVSEFEEWKKEIESQTKSKFVKCRGSRSNRNGTIVAVYNCHRSGFYHAAVKDKRMRSLKSSGSNKINGFCPASMSCIEYRGHIIVKYMPIHIGHSMDVKKLGLTENEKELIAEKLVNKVPMDKILEDLNESASNPSDKKRINLTTRKDFYNIIQKYNIKELAVYSQFKNEWKKFNSWVEALTKSSNVVRFYKPPGKLSQLHSEFKNEDFCLLIASDEQLEMLKTHGNNCICIDNVYKVNINDFELYTILVLDEFRESFPCAFIFSSRVDDNALRVYFKIIKSVINCELCPRHFVSDWANSIFNAWTSIFKELPGRNLFTCSHIEGEWRKNLNKIKSKERQIDVFNKIKALLNLRNFAEFEERSKLLMKELSYNFETKVYSHYFQKFLCEPHAWASCYRLNAEINLSLNIAELYANIEYFLVKNKKVKCLTKTAQALINYTTEKFKLKSDISYQAKIEKKINEIISGHRMSLELQDSIIEINDHGWTVISIIDSVEYRDLVFKDDVECTCSLICPDCSVCVHAYSCTCLDATVDLKMCQHIHLIISCLQNHTLPCEMDTSEVLEVQVVSSDSNQINENDAGNMSDEIGNQVKGEYQIDICEDDKEMEQSPAQFEAKKFEFIERLTTIVSRIETEEELNAIILQNSPLEEILLNVKGKKKFDDCSETGTNLNGTFYDQDKFNIDNDVKNKYIDENVEEAEQIALEVIVES